MADVLTPEKQAEITVIVDALAAFHPTKIVVERRPERAARLDSLYSAYRAGHYVLARGEDEQLGFRLAERFGLDRVYPADHGGDFPFDAVMAYAQVNDPAFAAGVMQMIGQMTTEMDSLQKNTSIAETLRFLNRPDVLSQNHAWYVGTAAVGAGDGYAGADLLSAWYDRNIRIFANIAALAEPGDRVLVIFGAAHAPILRQLIDAAPGMKLVDAGGFL